MFDIEYKGGNSVVITTKKATIVIDPKLSEIGLKDITTKDAIEVATEPRLALGDPQAQVLIEGPGEYEMGDLSFKGIGASRYVDKATDEYLSTIYHVEINDIRIGVIGNIAAKLSEDQLEELGVIDILVLPVGGGGLTLDAGSAASLIRQIDPKVVIPTHYAAKGLLYEVPQDSLEVFVKELGAPVESVSRYKVKSAASLPDTLIVVSLDRS